MKTLEERRRDFFAHAAEGRAMAGALAIEAAKQSYVPSGDVAYLRLWPEFGWVDAPKEGEMILSLSRELLDSVLITAGEAHELLREAFGGSVGDMLNERA